MEADTCARFDGPWYCSSPTIDDARSSIAAMRKQGNVGQIVLLYAESGLGKTCLMDRLLLSEAQAEAEVRRITLSDSASEPPTGKLSRLAREVLSLARRDSRVAVGIDDVPAGSEDVVEREARYIRRMAAAGALVIVCLLPESEGLVELLGEAMVIRSEDFLLGESCPEDPQGACGIVSAFSHGIPELALSSSREESLGDIELLDDSEALRYSMGLSRAVRGHLRESLSDEELALRLSMVLLGSGGIDDLAKVAPRVDDDLLHWLEGRAPFFGVRLSDDSFEVAGVCHDILLRRCLASVREAAARHQSLAIRAMRVLCKRASFVRASYVASLVSGEGEAVMHELVLSNGIHFLMAGKVSLVGEALRHMRELGMGDCAMSGILRQMLREFSGRRAELEGGRRACEGLRALLPEEREAISFLGVQVRQRDLLSKGSSGEPAGAGTLSVELARNPSLRRLQKHHHVTELLVQGKFANAFDLLLNDPDRLSPHDLGSAFLCLDFVFVEAMILEKGVAAEKGDVALARRLLVEFGPGRLGQYFCALESMATVLADGSSVMEDAEQIVSRASSFGDTTLEAALLLTAAIADLRSDALTRAHVRAGLAHELADGAGLGYLASAALFVDGMARHRLGERIKLPERQDMPSGALRDLMRILSDASGGRLVAKADPEVLSRLNFPREYLWALRLLVEDTGELVGTIRSSVPSAWLQLLPRFAELGPLPQKDQDVSCETGQKKAAGGRIRITLLGGFEVEVDGEAIDPEKLFSRHARELLALLSLVRGHKMLKRDALLAIWGDVDYLRGVQRLYECIAVIRRVLDVKAHGIEVIRSSRPEGTIELDSRYVSCDVDAFEAEALEALGREKSDLRSMGHACTARKLYGTGPAIVLDDITGISQSRAIRLREIYVTALVAGASAALREGKPHLCAQLSQDALQEEPRREDAIMCLAEAMGQMGRTSEVLALREQYRRRTSRTGRARSQSLEEAFEDALRKCQVDLDS